MKQVFIGIILGLGISAILFFNFFGNKKENVVSKELNDNSQVVYVKGESVYLFDIRTNQEKIIAKGNLPQNLINYEYNPEYFVFTDPKFLDGTNYILITKDEVFPAGGGRPTFTFFVYDTDNSKLTEIGVGYRAGYLENSRVIGFMSGNLWESNTFLNFYDLNSNSLYREEFSDSIDLNEALNKCNQLKSNQNWCKEYNSLVMGNTNPEIPSIDYDKIIKESNLIGYKALDYYTKNLGNNLYAINFLNEDEELINNLSNTMNLNVARTGVTPGYTDTVGLIYDNNSKKVVLKFNGVTGIDLKN